MSNSDDSGFLLNPRIAKLCCWFGVLLVAVSIGVVQAAEFTVKLETMPDLKAVFGQVESRDLVIARARIGGTLTALNVQTGSPVKLGDVIAVVTDDKLAIQLRAVDGRLQELDAQLKNVQLELSRAKTLLASGAISKSRIDQLQMQDDVIQSQIIASQASRAVIEQQMAEGSVLAPAPGRVLTVPVTKTSVVMPGETIARIAGGGYYLRLSLPERHAAQLRDGQAVLVSQRGEESQTPSADLRQGKVVKIYPEIESGHVRADIEVEGLDDFFVGERLLVWVPVGQRRIVRVPELAISTRSGVDYVRLSGANGQPQDVAVILGDSSNLPDGTTGVEILSGLQDGDKVITP